MAFVGTAGVARHREYERRLYVLKGRFPNIASTDIRARLKEGKSVRRLVPSAVAALL
jgi:nicotinic acid mononucleotide adenylyltransferase